METRNLTGSPQAAASGPAESVPRAVRVWLVDDNEPVRTLVAEMLRRFGGIECARHFSSPDELLSTLASKPGPDVILLDVQMGERNGIDAVRPIKSLTRSTRVMMFTSCNDREWRSRALSEGASDYLLKSDAVERVADRIRNPAGDPAPGLPSRRRATCRSEQILRNHQTSSVTERAPRLLSRAMKMLGLLSN
jgi:DNA-binding NarL/FixJ family response regulator